MNWRPLLRYSLKFKMASDASFIYLPPVAICDYRQHAHNVRVHKFATSSRSSKVVCLAVNMQRVLVRKNSGASDKEKICIWFPYE